MKHKVAELKGALLAHAVAKACGYKIEREGRSWTVWLPREATPDCVPCASFGPNGWRPDINWAHGGPIIEREWVAIRSQLSAWMDVRWAECGDLEKGRELLVWFMRAYVASKFGEEVELP